MDKIIYEATKNYYVALMTIIYCFVIMVIMFVAIKNALWQVMLFSIFINMPVLFLAKKTLKKFNV